MDKTSIEAAGGPLNPQPEATPNTEPTQAPAPAPQEPAAAPDMHGFTSAELAELRKFYDSRGGFDKVTSMLSNPQPKAESAQPAQPAQPTAQPTAQPEQPAYHAPAGSITAQEFLAQQYFGALANDPKYASIADEVRNGAVLKDMAAFNIRPLNQDGSINDTMVRRYLDLKAQTVVAKQTSAAPEASAAPTVDYVPFSEQVTDMRQAMAVLQQDSQLKSRGLAGHPNAAQAEEFMKKQLNKSK